MALAESLEKVWYEGARAPWWAWPLMWLYAAVMRLRRAFYAIGVFSRVRLACPVIVIGNVTVGGTGKTPLTIALARALQQRGFRPGVVSRGYGGTEHGPLLLDDASTPVQVGDEPALMRAHGLTVAIGRDRPAAGRRLIEAGCNVIIADDGLQHYRLARDLEICVIDGARRFGNGRLLPLGPLRESAARAAQTTFQVCNGERAGAGEVPMRLEGGTLRALVDGHVRPLEELRGHRVHAVAGIGNPQRFFDSLRARGLEVVPHPFPDHHRYVASDIDFGDCSPVLMTEKDAIKCQAFAQPHWWAAPVTAELPEAFFDDVAARLDRVDTARDLP
ncbi:MULTISPECIES: tetraacyldisaccharide 4'-kinase [Dyella]|uniref:Tetraacyldisaccharide 4'-kinase n=2 Tax=Dyella TaxID=231454 RepID=A0A4R0YUZ0_9GAMM|nr:MULTISPECIES: tetraacyldisaccharide 4'-kinase [Dyella]TBR39169.1 tetraacyldisaccharide 4'-kinase [Dyella terrae]TCI13245.1 tetraacyldisaccharide 4'-kinase [Dyella soli]